VGYEEQDIDEEAQEADEEVEDANHEQQQQVPGRVGRAAEVSDDGKDEHDESYDGGNRVNNEKTGKSGTGGGREIEVVGAERPWESLNISFLAFKRRHWSPRRALTDIVADLDWGAALAVAVAKDAKVDSLPAAQWDDLNDGSRQNRE
jgi:hypothetical protein